MKINTENLTRKTSFIMAYNIFGAVLGYVTLFFILRITGTAAWGILGAATGTVGLLTLIADFGISNAHVKKFSEGGDSAEKLGAYITLKIIYASVFVVLAFLAVFVVTDLLGFKFESPYLKSAVTIIIMYYFLYYIGGIFKTNLRAHMKTTQATIPDFIRVATQDAFLIVSTLWWVKYSTAPVEYLGVLYSYGYLISVFVQILALVYFVKDDLHVRKPSSSTIKNYVLFSIPLGLFGAVGIIQGYTDRTMLQFFWNYKEVGAYFSIQRIVVAITTFGMAVSFVLYPAQAHHYSWGDKKRFSEITLGAERYISLLILPLVIFGIVLAPELLNLWNKTLISYYLVLQILLIYSYLYVLNVPYSSQLVSANKPKETLKAGVIQATFNVVLNAILIPTSILGIHLFGLKSVGAATATMVSFIIGFIIIRIKSYTHLGCAFNQRIIIHFIAATLAGIALYLINKEIYHFTRFYELGIAFGLFICIYFILLLITKELSVNEIYQIFSKFIKYK